MLTPPRQLQSLGGLNGLFEQMRQKFGDTTGFEMNIRPDRATLYRPDTEDPRRKLMYDYRGGWGDPYSTTTVDSDDRVVDLSKFNVEQTIAVLRGAPESLEDPAKGHLRHLDRHRTVEGSGHARRGQHPHLRQQRVRQRLHRLGARRRDQADQLTQLAS